MAYKPTEASQFAAFVGSSLHLALQCTYYYFVIALLKIRNKQRLSFFVVHYI